MASGGVRQAAASIPSAAGRQALLTAYQDGFASTFDHLMAIAAIIAMVGAIGCLFLVRQKDFVPSIAAGRGEAHRRSDLGADADDDGPARGLPTPAPDRVTARATHDRPGTAGRPGTRRAPPRAPGPRRPHARADILAAHRAARLAGQSSYVDPATGYLVMTSTYLADRGTCCHQGCRHCPYLV